MAYQSIHTGTSIDDGISINSTQNQRLTDLENKDVQFNTTINNLNTEITDLKNKVNTNTTNITSLQNKVIPISQGGTGATTVNQAMSNLGGAYATARWDITSNQTGTISTTLTLTTHGRPVFVGIQYTMQGIGGSGHWGTASIFRDSTHLQSGTIVSSAASYNNNGAILYLDIVPAGTYTYKFQYGVGSGTIQLNETNNPSGHQPETPVVFAFEI